MSVISMLDREVYLYAEVDRLVGLRGGTARRWINGYQRRGRPYDPILRLEPRATEWATWGEFVEVRILAEYRDEHVPTTRLRAAVESLRETFQLRYPLANLRPYLSAQAGEVAIAEGVGGEVADRRSRGEGWMVARTRQMLLGEPSQSVMRRAVLTEDEAGEKVVAEIAIDPDFPDIVISPSRYSGQPTFQGRRVSVATIAGMARRGERPEDLAADYGLSLAQVQSAVEYAAKHKLAA